MSTLSLITASMGRLALNSSFPCSTALIPKQPFLNTKNEGTAINVDQQKRGLRRKFPGFKRNWPEFQYYIFENRHHNVDAWKIPRTRSYRFPGHIDIYDRVHGKRESLDAAVQRFKRLDFGAYINTMIGKNNKMHQKTHAQQRRKEHHVFSFFEFQ